MPENTAVRHSPLLLGTAALAWLWELARACVQSLTIDEADTYLYFVRRPGPSHWDASANNHVLNSLLMRLFTSIFGPSPLSIRLPALIGAAIYMGAAYFLVRLITQRRQLQWSILVCLICSPFVMDYLVAARGYSLASGFLLSMITLAAWHMSHDHEGRKRRLRNTCLWISVCAGLCFSANFSFAIADGLVALGLYGWLAREHRADYRRLLAYFTLPGLIVIYFLVGSIVLRWPKGQFTWGATSLLEMIKSLVRASLFEPNQYLLNPRLHHQFVHFGTFLYPLLMALLLWRLVVLGLERRIGALARICGGTLVIALLLHQLLYSVFGVLLPLDRTAMWVVLLFLVMAGALATTGVSSRMGLWSGRALSFLLAILAVYNLGCLRLSYFNEWKYDADMNNVYWILTSYRQKYGVTKVSANWRYVAALNGYRAISGKDTFESIPTAPSVANYYPSGYQAYVVYYPWDQEFLQKEGLKLTYHDDFTNVAIAIRPDVDSPAASSSPAR